VAIVPIGLYLKISEDVAMTDSPSPFHRGEQKIQQQLGVREQMERFGSRVIRDHMPQQHRDFYRQLPFIFTGHADAKGWPWASILFNRSEFISAPNSKTLNIETQPVSGDPLAASWSAGTRLGLLGIELPTRRRNRLAAHIVESNETGIALEVDQCFGNCPQYIQSRELSWLPQADVAAPISTALTTLDERSSDLIEASDTFFVASYVDTGSERASDGADVSHRGGRPGFVRIDNNKRLTIPDYLGNNHFNTFGNFIENSRAGILFLDFEKGHLLTLTGTVEILWDSPQAQHFDGAERLWQFTIDHGHFIEHALPMRWSTADYSPNTLLTGTWIDAKNTQQAEAQRQQWLPYTVVDIVTESSVIKSFYLQPQTGGRAHFKPGQFLTVKLDVNGSSAIRTYTVSSAPSDPELRISVKAEQGIDENAPQGLFSNHLHQHVQVGDTVYAKAPCGAFTFDASEQRPAVLLAAGVGITPMVAMARHALAEGMRTRQLRSTTIIAAASNAEQRAFFDELADIELRSGGGIRSFWALSEVDAGAQLGRDYHLHGRIESSLLQSILVLDDYDFYLCGPASFMQSMYAMLRGLGVSDARIVAEEFGPASLKRDSDQASEAFEPVTAASEAIVEFRHSNMEQAWTSGDGSLLEFAEAHGLSPEFGCRSGQCGACKVGLLSGEVSYLTEPSSPLAAGEVLMCCAVPAAVTGEEVVKLVLEL